MQWRYCGRFSQELQDALPTPDSGWINEAEAQRRYGTKHQALSILPPINPATGIAPFIIQVITGPTPDFHVIHQVPPGIEETSAHWTNLGDGRLFCDHSVILELPPREQITGPGPDQWLMRAIAENKQDGTGTLRIEERDHPGITTAKRDSIPLAPLYQPVPGWGQWQQLANPPQTP